MRLVLAAAARRAALATPRRAATASAAPQRATTLLITSEAGTASLAAALASAAVTPAAVCLYGDVGAGKSAFARAFVRAAAGDDELPVPSPTYLLHNVYDDVDGERREGWEGVCACVWGRPGEQPSLTPPFSPSLSPHTGPPIHHFDLYRLGGAGGDRVSSASRDGGSGTASTSGGGISALDTDRVGLAAALTDGVCLIEWADRLGGTAPSSRLDVALEPLAQAAAAAAAACAGVPPPLPSSDPFADARWRRVTLTQHGTSAAVATLVAGAEAAVDGVGVVRVV